MGEMRHRAHCARMDHGGCGLLVTVKDGRIVRIQGDPESPISRGYVCPKGLAAAERLEHPDRLLHPMVRDGARGKGRWRRVGWPEALELLSGKIQQVQSRWGARSVLFGQGAPKGPEFFLLLRLANVLGSPNVAGPQNVCHMPREIAAVLTCGFWPEVDYDHPPGCILLWGSNLRHTNEEGVIQSRLNHALRRGSRLIVVDPRPTSLAKRADIWLRLRPGTDAALALGMMRVIIDEGLEDRPFLANWTTGYPDLLERLRQWPIERVQEITWVDGEKIREAAILYGRSKPAAIQMGNALEHNIQAHQNCRTVLCLIAITGNLETPGGNYRAGAPPSMPLRDMVLPNRIPRRSAEMISGPMHLHPMLATVPVQLAARAMAADEPYPVRAAFLIGTNPLISYPDSHYVRGALERLEFLAVADMFLTPTAALADLVLPAATNFEFDDIGHYGLPHGFILARPKLVEAPGEAWPDIRILNELGKRLGFEECFWKDERDMLEAILGPSGMCYRDFRKQGILLAERSFHTYTQKGFRTASKKVEFFSATLERMGLDPLPSYEDPMGREPGPNDPYPFVLTSAKSPAFFHSAHRQIASLRDRFRDPVVEMAPEAAADIGVREGDWVWIRTPRGRIRQRALLRPGMDPRVVCGSHGWWFPEQGAHDLFGWNVSNYNVLTGQEPPYDPLVASVNLRCIPCAVEKISEG